MKTPQRTAGWEEDGYVSLCPELDIASQGATVEEAKANLREAVELFLESADPREIEGRLKGEVFAVDFRAQLRKVWGKRVFDDAEIRTMRDAEREGEQG